MLHVMLDAPAPAKQILSDRQVDYVVLCPGSLEMMDFNKLAPDGLAARLGRGQASDDRKRIDIAPTALPELSRVRRITESTKAEAKDPRRNDFI